MATIGSNRWSLVTHGNMRFQDRWRSFIQLGVLQVSNRLQRMIPQHLELAHCNVDEILIPDTAIVHSALALCQNVSAPFLAHHCLRTYVWGAVFARRDRLRYDAELLFVSAILHDMGLIASKRKEYPHYACFAVAGGFIASDFAKQHDWPPERCDSVFRNISMHLNIRVPTTVGVEAHLVHAGAAFDVLGSRTSHIPASVQQSVFARYPRLDFTDGFTQLIRGEAELHAESRIGFLCQKVHFAERIKASQFSEYELDNY